MYGLICAKPLAKNHTVEDAIGELVMNAIDVGRKSTFTAPGRQTVEVVDEGKGLGPDAFLFGEGSEDKVYGRFGLGLKDAVCHSPSKAPGIVSSQGTFTFREQESGKGSRTVHFLHTVPIQPAPVGTRITVVGSFDALKSLAAPSRWMYKEMSKSIAGEVA
jgi:hypothetical protein